eukprot:752626-Hanusia_phi.AAC.1
MLMELHGGGNGRDGGAGGGMGIGFVGGAGGAGAGGLWANSPRRSAYQHGDNFQVASPSGEPCSPLLLPPPSLWWLILILCSSDPWRSYGSPRHSKVKQRGRGRGGRG